MHYSVYFVLAFIVFGIIACFSPDNSPRTRMERLLKMVPVFLAMHRHDDIWNKLVLVLDPHSRRFAIGRPGQPVRVIGFDDLVAVEVERDGVTIEKTNRGAQVAGAVVGAALLGGVGLLIGGLTGSKRQKEKVERLTLKLIVNDMSDPVIPITFMDLKAKPKMKPAAPVKEPPEQRLGEWYGRFRVILHEQGHSAPAPAASTSASGFGRRRGLLAS